MYDDAELECLIRELDEAHNKSNEIHFRLNMAWNIMKDKQKPNDTAIEELEEERERCFDIEQAYYFQSMACFEYKNHKAALRYSADAKKMKKRQLSANDNMHVLIRINRLFPESIKYSEVLEEFKQVQLAVDEAQAKYDTRLCELRIKANSA